MARAYLPEADARRVWLARALESDEAAAARLPAEERLLATDMAASGPGGAPFLGRRAAHLLALVSRRDSAPGRAERAAAWPRLLDWGVPLLAFAAGLGAQALDGREISIIFFPLLGMLAWNLAVYLFIAAAFVVGLAHRATPDRPWLGRAAGWAMRRLPGDAALKAFARDWTAAAAPLWGARARRVLHLSAAALALGALASMYVNPFGVDYRVGWESERFANAPQALLPVIELIYGPASRLTGIPLPDAQGLAAMSWANGGDDDAWPWIQLFAATAALFIIGPRLLLAVWSAWRAARLARRVPVPGQDDPWAARLFGHTGAALAIRVQPVFYTPPAGAAERLRAAAAEAAGGRAAVTVAEPARFGEEPRAADADADRCVLLFNLAATPEAETHGAFARATRARAAGVSALVDEAAYRARLGPGAEAGRRLDERRRAWRAVLAAAGVDAGFTDLSAAPPNDPAIVRALLGAAA